MRFLRDAIPVIGSIVDLKKVTGNHIETTFWLCFGWTDIRKLNRTYLVFAWKIIHVLMDLFGQRDIHYNLCQVYKKDKSDIYENAGIYPWIDGVLIFNNTLI